MDTRAFHAIIGKNAIDTIITSPPYWNLKDYGAENQVGFGQSKENYMNDIEALLTNWHEMVKSTGSLWLIADNYRKDGEVHLLPWEIADRAAKVGWKIRDFIIWDKQYNVPWHQRGQMRNTSEFIVFMTKSDKYKYYVDRIKELDELSKWWVDYPERFNPKGKTPTNIWSFPIRRRGTWPQPSKVDHYCSLPGSLVGRIIELTTDEGDMVSDPFAGSGVVLAQAKVMKRHFAGCELNDNYVKMFDETLKEVESEWEQLKQRRAKFDFAKIDFEKTVMALRTLKYSRQISIAFSSFAKKYKLETSCALISLGTLPKEFDRNTYLKVNLIFIVDELPTKYKRVLAEVIKRSQKTPLSHFGIDSDISIMTYEQLVKKKKLNLSAKLYMYPSVHVRKHTATKILSNWFSPDGIEVLTQEKKNIPILSNLEVDVEWAFS